MPQIARLLFTLCVTVWFLAPGPGMADNLCTETDAAKFVSATAHASAQQGVRLVPTYDLLPAGAPATIAIDRIYDNNVKKVKVAFQLGRALEPKDQVWPIDDAIPSKIPNENPLVTGHLVSDGSTLLAVDVPRVTYFRWRDGAVTVVGCGADNNAVFIGRLKTVYSGHWTVLLVTLAVTAAVYLFAAVAVSHYEKKTRTTAVPWYRYLDPVVLCSNSNSEGSLSRLQISSSRRLSLRCSFTSCFVSVSFPRCPLPFCCSSGSPPWAQHRLRSWSVRNSVWIGKTGPG